MDEIGREIDFSCDSTPLSGGPVSGTRPFLGLRFMCCDVYSRVYPNRDNSAYVGNCPRCAKRVQLRIGSNGTDARFFEVW